jgi:cytochrome c oxidase subunit III
MEAMSLQQNKIHPHKFTLWVAIGSIIMMFAGLTSAYIVKRNQPGWEVLEIPRVFWYSTGVLLASSVTVQMALRSFKEREMTRYRGLITLTALLGIVFLVLQVIGFMSFEAPVIGRGSNPSRSFLLAISGLHGLHVIGGVIALLIMFFRAFSQKTRFYTSTPIEVVSTYWHFVDLLWIYLFVFFQIMA